jgi:hypothetical protein
VHNFVSGSIDAGMNNCADSWRKKEFASWDCMNWMKLQGFRQDYCERELDLLLTPVTVDPAHPFPRH